jgi:D-alanyl-D-alanine carboxypeptidase
MPSFPRRINGSEPRRRQTLAFPLLAGAVALAVIFVLLHTGAHRGARTPGPTTVPSAATTTVPSRSPCQSPTGASSRSSTGAPVRAREAALTRSLDAVLRAARRRTHAPAATAAVVACGRLVWAGASGVLDLRSRRPATTGSLFIVNSAVKTVVATMVMREIENGRLSLNSRLSQFYPWLPNARRITVRMLLNMTSGLPDYLSNPRVQQMIHQHPRHHWTVDQVLSGLGTGLGAPLFTPGSRFQYSDTNYIVLGAILRRITHSSTQQDFEQLIGRPAGITSGTFVPSPAAEARLAHPYVLTPDGALASRWIPGYGVASVVWGPVFTDGGLAISSPDFARFGNALIGDRLVGPSQVRQMTRIGRGDYGFGIRGRNFGGRLWLGHRGYFGGFEAEEWSNRSQQITIATVTDLQTSADSEPTSTRIWTAVTRAYEHHLRS